jgi:hypothetical protein
MKKCSMCHMTLPAELFYKNVAYSSGYSLGCKDCLREKSRVRYHNNSFIVSNKKVERYIKYLSYHGFKVIPTYRRLGR